MTPEYGAEYRHSPGATDGSADIAGDAASPAAQRRMPRRTIFSCGRWERRPDPALASLGRILECSRSQAWPPPRGTASPVTAGSSRGLRPRGSRPSASRLLRLERWRLPGWKLFADAIFAIAATLLILDVSVHAPGGSLGAAIKHAWPQYAAYGVSFLIIGIWWVNHHHCMTLIDRADLALQARGGASRRIEGEAATRPLLPETRRFRGRRGLRRGRRTMPTSG